MNLYAESSAVLAWLPGEEAGALAREALGAAHVVVASELTIVECDRALVRGVALGALNEAEATARRGILAAAAAGWQILGVDDAVLERARRPFPVESVRTLDALHLASALEIRSVLTGLTLLTLSQRIAANGRELGLPVAPRRPV